MESIDEGYSIYLLCKKFIILTKSYLISGQIDLMTYRELTDPKCLFIRNYEIDAGINLRLKSESQL